MLSVILPAFNESHRLEKTLCTLNEFFSRQKMPTEILVINDGSSDKTAHIAHDFFLREKCGKVISLPTNQGKGAAIARGVAEAKGEWILTADADNATPIEEFSKLFAHRDEQSVVIGSRYLAEKTVMREQPKFRFFLGKTANALIRGSILSGISDTQCGFKLFPSAAAKMIFAKQKITRFAFDIETLVIARDLGYAIHEIPVSWFHQSESRVRPIRDALKTLWDLLRILWYRRRGEYF